MIISPLTTLDAPTPYGAAPPSRAILRGWFTLLISIRRVFSCERWLYEAQHFLDP